MSTLFSKTPIIIQDGICLKISELWRYCDIKDCIYEFIENYVKGHPNELAILSNLSNLYCLFVMKKSENILRDDEPHWKDILTPEQHERLEKNRVMILGYMLVNPSSNYPSGSEDKTKSGIHLIEYMNTRLRGYGIAQYMMYKYEDDDICLLPRIIIHSSAKYWDRFLPITITDIQRDYPLLITDEKLNWSALSYLEDETD